MSEENLSIKNLENIVANKILKPCFTEDHIRDSNVRDAKLP